MKKKLIIIIPLLLVIGILIFTLKKDESIEVSPSEEVTIDAEVEDVDSIVVNSAEELSVALKTNDEISMFILEDGVYENELFVVNKSGSEENPIIFKAKNPGKAILTGTSRLRIAGDYVVVDGLFFKDGYLEGAMGSVVEFRYSKEGSSDIEANHSTLRNTVIANYNNDDRLLDYKWVSLYGTYNTVEYSELIGKNTSGVAMAVWRDNDDADYHTIRNNKFMYIESDEDGNGAEALRIGTSTHSLSDSYTLVENNYFEQCNGEIEIISNKSGNNTYKGNIFVDNEGMFTIRHGNDVTVDGNYFFGNGYEGTGGIRVIGENHIVTNNYIEGVMGDGGKFRAAITLTNGVPDSPLNRYFQVKNAYVANNVLVNNRNNIYIGSGVSEELSLPPVNPTFENNIVISSEDSQQLVKYYDEPENIKFVNNKMTGTVLGIDEVDGIEITAIEIEEKYGLKLPKGSTIKEPTSLEEIGANWSKELSGDSAFKKRNLFEEFYAKEVTVLWAKLKGVAVVGVGSPDAFIDNKRYKIDFKDNSVRPIKDGDEVLIPRSFIENHFGESDAIKDDFYITTSEVSSIYNKSVHVDEAGFVIMCDDIDILELLQIPKTLGRIGELYKITDSSNDGNVATNIMDGLLASRWSSNGDGQWIEFKLDEETEISSVDITFYKGKERQSMFEIQVSNDQENWTSVYEGISSGESDKFERFEFESVIANYVRIVGHMNTSNTWNSYGEVMFYDSKGQAVLDYLSHIAVVVVEEVMEEYIPVVTEGTPIEAIADAYVEAQNPDLQFGINDADKLRVKSKLDGSIIRISYVKFDTSEMTDFSKAIFQIAGKVSTNNPANPEIEIEVYGIHEDNWEEDTITWNNSPNHAETSPEIVGLNESAFLLGTFTMDGPGINKFYTVDVTEFVKSQDDGIVTLMLVDSKIQNLNSDPYSKERSNADHRPYIFFQN